MASLNPPGLSLYPQLETILMSTRKVIELLLQLKNAKAHGKNYIKVKPHLVRHLLRNCLFFIIAPAVLLQNLPLATLATLWFHSRCNMKKKHCIVCEQECCTCGKDLFL